MTDLVAFLEARLRAEEALALGVTQFNAAEWECLTTGVVSFGPPDHEMFNANDRDLAEHIKTWDPARVLAEVAAKRALIAQVMEWMRADEEEEVDSGEINMEAVCLTVLHSLAAPCADHEDFDESWRT